MTTVTLDAGPDDDALRHNQNCRCRTCRRRTAMLEPGRVPRVDAVTGRSWPNPDEPDQDLPPQHPITGRFMADRHAVHPDRNVNGEFIDEDAYDD
jgi:hypothetical protein